MLSRLMVRCELKLKQHYQPLNSASEGMQLSSGNFLTAMPAGVIDGIDMEATGRVRNIRCRML